MTKRTKTLRTLFAAFALAVLAPIAGVVPGIGVTAAIAQETRAVAAVAFDGNIRFSDAQLQTMVNATSGVGFSDGLLQQDIATIEAAYRSAGYNGAEVTARSEILPDSRVRVVFVVNEGDKVGIAAVNFTGNNAISSSTLAGIITTKATNLLSWLVKDDVYSEERLTLDREIIRRYYGDRGFPDAQVLSAVAEYDPARNAYFINFAISEGERYTIGNVDVQTSIAGLDTAALNGTIETRAGDNFSISDLEGSQEDMAFAATAQGYSFADVRARVDRDINNRIFNITYLVDEGARVYVERINITGNTKTRDFVIRRELDFAEGDPFNRSMVTRGRSAIQDLGFFSAVNVSTSAGSAADRIVINIAVVEQTTGEYGASLGYSTADGVLGEVSLTERNFLGRGQYLRVAVGATQAGRTFDLSFTEPRFMGLDIAAGVDVYHRISQETTRNFFGSTSTGGQLRFGIPLTEDLTGTVFAGYEYREFTDNYLFDHDNDPDTPPRRRFVGDSSVVMDGDALQKAFIGYTLSYNTVDDPRSPREGFVANFTQQYVGLDHNYIRSELRARYFMPIIEDSGIVASIRGQAGIINNLDDGGVHPVEAFYLGPNFVRGFQNRGIGPRLGSGESVGATMYAGISGEIEFPIPVLPENFGIRGAVFADAGWVGGLPGDGTDGPLPTPIDGTDEPWRASIGASIIWNSPFGPLRGDVAHILRQDPADNTQVFSLTLSTLL